MLATAAAVAAVVAACWKECKTGEVSGGCLSPQQVQTMANCIYLASGECQWAEAPWTGHTNRRGAWEEQHGSFLSSLCKKGSALHQLSAAACSAQPQAYAAALMVTPASCACTSLPSTLRYPGN